jgi:hypothetical protein
VPSGQLWPSGLSTVIVQRPPKSRASPLHPLELVTCATHPLDGPQASRAVHAVVAPAPIRFNEYVPLKSSAHAGPANPTDKPAAIRVAATLRPTATIPPLQLASILWESGDFRSTTTKDTTQKPWIRVRKLCPTSEVAAPQWTDD